MSNFNFTKIKKGKFGNGTRMSGCLRINSKSVSVAYDIFNEDYVKVKFDVDTDNNAIRIRKGTEGGSRSYSLCPSNQSTGVTVSCGLPQEIRKLVAKGKLSMGTYNLVEGSNNVFVLA